MEPLHILRGCSIETSLFFELGKRARLLKVRVESKLVVLSVFQWIKVLEVLGRVWHTDPKPDSVVSNPKWHLWAWEAHPLTRLKWDPREW